MTVTVASQTAPPACGSWSPLSSSLSSQPAYAYPVGGAAWAQPQLPQAAASSMAAAAAAAAASTSPSTPRTTSSSSSSNTSGKRRAGDCAAAPPSPAAKRFGWYSPPHEAITMVATDMGPYQYVDDPLMPSPLRWRVAKVPTMDEAAMRTIFAEE